MPPFDPISSPTVRIAPHQEPAFVFPEQTEAARQKLAAYAARTGRRPNILVILFDDVGWGDFGCYGGGVAVGAPTPGIDDLARRGLRLTSCYSEPSCSLSGPEGNPQLSHAKARLRRGAAGRHAGAPRDVPDLSAEAGDGTSRSRSRRRRAIGV